MSFEWVTVDANGGVGEVVLRRPPSNVLHLTMIRELRRALTDVTGRAGVRAVLLRGEGKSFCTGVDVAEHLPGKCEALIAEFHGLLRDIASVEVPTIAQLHGNVLGGGLELAMATDLAYAAAGARLGQPEVKLAVFPPYAAALGPGLLGPRRAAELVLTGRTYTAAEAHRLGLVNDVFSDEEMPERVAAIVRGMASCSRPVLVLSKRALRSARVDANDPLGAAERLYLDELMLLSDAREGLQAFLDKRPPVWSDR